MADGDEEEEEEENRDEEGEQTMERILVKHT